MSFGLTSSISAAQQLQGLGALGNLNLNTRPKSPVGIGGSVNAANSAGPADPITLSAEAQAMIAQSQTQAAAQPAPTQNLTAQTAAKAKDIAANTKNTTDEFMKFAKENPAQRMYDQILSSMGLTQAQLDAMPADQKKAVMDKIAQIIKEKMHAQTGTQADTSGTSTGSTAVASAAAVAGLNASN